MAVEEQKEESGTAMKGNETTGRVPRPPLDRDLIHAIVQRDLRLLIRSIWLQRVLMLTMIAPSLLLLLGLRYGLANRLSPIYFLVIVLSTLLACIVASVLSWAMAILKRDRYAVRLEELMIIGCRPAELTAAMLIEAYVLVMLLSASSLPICLACGYVNFVCGTDAVVIWLIMTLIAILFIAFSVSSGARLNSLEASRGTSPQSTRQISISYILIWLFSRLLSLFQPALERFIVFLFRSCWRSLAALLLLNGLMLLAIGRGVPRIEGNPEDYEDLASRAKPTEPKVRRTLVREKGSGVCFSRGNPIHILDTYIRHRMGLSPISWLVITIAAFPVVLILLFTHFCPTQITPGFMVCILGAFLPFAVADAASDLYDDVASRQAQFFLLTRLSHLEIILGKATAVLAPTLPPLGIIAMYLLAAVPIGCVTLVQAGLYALSMAIIPASLVVLAVLLGARRRTAREALTVGTMIIVIPLIAALLLRVFGLEIGLAISPFTALASTNPQIIGLCLVLHAILGIGALGAGALMLDRIILAD